MFRDLLIEVENLKQELRSHKTINAELTNKIKTLQDKFDSVSNRVAELEKAEQSPKTLLNTLKEQKDRASHIAKKSAHSEFLEKVQEIEARR